MRRLVFLFMFSISITAMTQTAETLVVIHTDYGDITAKLYNDTPKHRDNFIKLVKEGWYNGSPFHRVIKDFMIQGGSNKDGRNDPGYRVPAEIKQNHIHTKGALAAARMPDNVNPMRESSGSQFYIVQGIQVPSAMLNAYANKNGFAYTDEQKQLYSSLGGTPHLDGGYTVFGEVVMGIEVVDKIAAVQTGRGDMPVEKVTMTIEILE